MGDGSLFRNWLDPASLACPDSPAGGAGPGSSRPPGPDFYWPVFSWDPHPDSPAGRLSGAVPGATGQPDGAKVQALRKACDDAFDWPPAAKSCSHAVWHVITELIDPHEEYRQANGLIDYMENRKTIWRQVSLDDGWKLANDGIVVVGGRADKPNGHVIVIYPGDKIPGGGYETGAVDPKTGKKLKMRSHGMRPRCLSRALGSWPGAVSKGDKNVFDPWGNDDDFDEVRFWTMDKP